MENKAKKKIKEADIKPTEIKPTEIKPTEIKPTEIKPTEIKPTEIKPTDIEPTEINPTDIEPTEINPSEIRAADIAPTDNKQKQFDNREYSKSNSIIGFLGFIVASLLTCIVWLTQGWQIYMFGFILGSLIGLVTFIRELKRMPITQKDIDEWNKKLPAGNQVKLENFNTFLNKVSFWLHKLGKPFVKVLASVAIVGVCALWVVTPILYSSGVAGGSSVAGNTYTDSPYSITFNSNNSYVQKYGSSTMDSGSWSQSGNKVTCRSNGGITIVFTVGPTYIQGADGIRWNKT